MLNLKSLRKKANKTQAQMAKYLNISQQAYAAYEVGKAQPPMDALAALADYFGVTTDYLYNRSPDSSALKDSPLDTLYVTASSLGDEDISLLIRLAERLRKK